MCDTIVLGASLLAVGTSSSYFFRKRGLRYLQYLQQEDYDGRRFLRWYKSNKAFDRRGSLVAIVAFVLVYAGTKVNADVAAMISLLFAVVLFYRSRKEENPFKTGKIVLKLTERAGRIFNTAQSAYALLQCSLAVLEFVLLTKHVLPAFWFSQLALIQLQPFILVWAKELLDPQEKEIQNQFAQQARDIVSKVNPTTIGITGSYGKTSAKVILSEILNSVAPTFTTPRSINSYMGVTREIRERLKNYHRFAVIEMGAYAQGSIRKMCSLTPPAVGIVTAVGEMHLERFGSVENLYQAKSELASAIPSDGILVLNGDYELCRRMAKEYPKRITLLYGLDRSKGPLDAYMYEMKATDDGTTFKIDFAGHTYEGFTKLLGKPLLSNALGAFTLAMAMGCAPEVILAAMRNSKTESNRLEPLRTTVGALAAFAQLNNGKQVNVQPSAQGKILRINDAFSSNPVGFSAALDLLAELPGQRKILVTPGMIELGDRQYSENQRAGKKAASICNMVVLVGSTNKDALLSGLQDGGLPQDKYILQEDMKQALKYLSTSYCAEGDVVLIENDLTDLYESVPKF